MLTYNRTTSGFPHQPSIGLVRALEWGEEEGRSRVHKLQPNHLEKKKKKKKKKKNTTQPTRDL
jgi:hypothetical protein